MYKSSRKLPIEKKTQIKNNYRNIYMHFIKDSDMLTIVGKGRDVADVHQGCLNLLVDDLEWCQFGLKLKVSGMSFSAK